MEMKWKTSLNESFKKKNKNKTNNNKELTRERGKKSSSSKVLENYIIHIHMCVPTHCTSPNVFDMERRTKDKKYGDYFENKTHQTNKNTYTALMKTK